MADKEDTNKLIEIGSKLTGSAIGGTVGSFIGLSVAGPPGAIGGAVIGNLLGSLTEIGGDFLHQKLSKKEEIRVGAAFNYTLYKVKQHISDGKEPRKDGFFESKIDNKSKAEEIFEGILIKSQLQYQEKKIRILSNIFANAAFREDISVEELHHLIRIVDELTYRELCILSLITQKNTFDESNSQPWQNPIGLIFPTDSAIVKEEELPTSILQRGRMTFMGKIPGIISKQDPKIIKELIVLPQKSFDFYYLHKEFTRLNFYQLVGDFLDPCKIDKEKLSEEFLKKKMQINLVDTEYSVFMFYRGYLADRYNSIMSLDDIEETDKEDLRKYIEPNIFLDVDLQVNPIVSFLASPDYLVTYLPNNNK
jgi:hypothetical protein